MIILQKKQEEYCRLTREKICVDEDLGDADFSENYSFVMQDGVLVCHWP